MVDAFKVRHSRNPGLTKADRFGSPTLSLLLLAISLAKVCRSADLSMHF
jgi:hypothetical protein